MSRTTARIIESLHSYNENERAVSPVLGVALLIAITVILAGVVGFIVLGVGTGGPDAPQAGFEFENESGTLTVVHTGGDKLESDDISAKAVDNSGDGADTASFSEDMVAGDSQDLSNNLESGDTIRIVWDDPNSDKTTVIVEHTVE